MTRKYTPQDEARVAGLRASGMKHHEIAAETGIPRRSVTAILDRTPVSEVVTAATLEQVSSALWQVVAAGTQEALRRIADPKTRAGELAQLLKVAAEQHALLTGGVTERTESLNVNADVEYVSRWSSPELRDHLIEWLDEIENASDAELAANDSKVQIIEGIARNMALGEARPTKGMPIELHNELIDDLEEARREDEAAGR